MKLHAFAFPIALAVLGMAGQPEVRAENEASSIENAWYRIAWNDQTERLTLRRKRGEFDGPANLTLPAPVAACRRHETTSSVFGPGRTLSLQHPDGSVTSLALYDSLTLAAVTRSIANRTGTTRRIDKLPIISAEFDLGAPAGELVARGTAGLTEVDARFGSYVFGAIANPKTREGVVFAWASNRKGQGIVFPERCGTRPGLRTRIDYGDLRLSPGEEEPGELLLIGLHDDVRDGLEAYADATARFLDIHLRPLPCVYCTWYHSRASDAMSLARNTEFAARHLRPWGLRVMQIDDGWQPGLRINGPKRIFDMHDPDGPYPDGMKATADRIKAQGMVPGIWFMPLAGTWLDPYFADKQEIFYRVGDGDATVTEKEMKDAGHDADRPIRELPYSTSWAGTCIDGSNPTARQYVRQMVHRIAHDWGYEYFKMDGFHTGTGSTQKYIGNEYVEDDLGKTLRHDPGMTPLEAYQAGMRVIREAAGEDVFFLGCCMVQNLRCFGTTFGHLDAMRVGPDNGSRWEKHDRGPRYGGRYYFLNKRVWYCDPDPFYVRPSLTRNEAITLASYVALSGQLAASSYAYDELPADRLDIIRRVMPTHNLKSSRPLDFLERDVPHEWLLVDDTQAVRRVVVGHFHWGSDEPIVLETPLEDLGLAPETSHVGFDYWADEFVTDVRGSLRTTLPPASCRIVSLYPESAYPRVVGTSRSITQGITDLVEESWDDSSCVLSGASRVVAGDPYEIRILLPADEESWEVEGTEVADGVSTTPLAVARRGREVRATMIPAGSETLTWRIAFRRPE